MKLAVDIRQKPAQRGFPFLRRNMYKSSRSRGTWDSNHKLSEECYALAHMMAAINKESKLTQHFLDLHPLPCHIAKGGTQSLISAAISEVDELKIRIEDLEQRNQTLMNSFTGNMIQNDTSLSHDYARISSGQGALMHFTSDQVSVMIEETHIADEAVIEVTLKKTTSNSTFMELIVAILKRLREINLEVVRVQCRSLVSTNQVIQMSIRSKRKGEGWQTFEWKRIEDGVKLVLTSA